MKRVLRILGVVILLATLLLAAGLGWAHWSLRRVQPPLPDLMALTPPVDTDLPISVSYINTASQTMPRSAVLDGARDPSPDAEYVMSFPAFVLRWTNGRLLLIDAGMTGAAALDFGKPLELLAGASAIAPHASVAATLGRAARRVRGVVFTHLHTDHVDGLPELCDRGPRVLRVFMTPMQAEHTNYTTRPGRAIVDAAPCARIAQIPADAISDVRGFPGVSLVAVGGHTPGTQVVLAWVAAADGPRLYAFVGDIVNNIDGINHNISKPFLYSLLVVPEDTTRLSELRTLLRRLRDERGATIVVSHDALALRAAGLQAYRRTPPRARARR